MRRMSFKAMALAALLGAASAQAQERATITLENSATEPIAAQKTDAKASSKTEAPKLAEMAVGESAASCCAASCCNRGGFYAEYEQLFLQYQRADGVRIGTGGGESVRSDFEAAPRISVGYLSQSGLGFRARYFEYDHRVGFSDNGADESLHVDTYNIDGEIFQVIPIGNCWSVEAALGVRYNRFNEQMFDDGDVRFNRFHGIGGIASLEARRTFGDSLAIFGRVRGALLVGDKSVFNSEENDDEGIQNTRLENTSQGMIELALGAEYHRTLNNGWRTFFRVSAEYQNWFNFSSGFVDTDSNERFGGPSDVGFAGIGLSIGITR